MSTSNVHRGISSIVHYVAPTAICALMMIGCETGQPTTTFEASSGERATVAPSGTAAELEDHEPSPGESLAVVARRDVEAFLKARASKEPSAEDNESTIVPQASPGRRIAWNDPMRLGLPGRDIAADARLDDPGVEAGTTLLRTADPLPQVSEPTSAEGGNAGKENAGTLDRDRLRELVIDLSRELYREAAHADMPLRELLLIAATTLVSPDRAISPEAIPGLTAREREVLGRFQQFFAELGTKLDGSADADAIIMDEIDALRRELSTEPRLELSTLALCTRVGGFGDYDAFSRYKFLAHAEQQAIVYIEIAGFVSELNEKGQWATELSQQLVIYSDRDGIPVWREDWQSAVDLSRNKRTDFFLVQLITLPRALSVGRYHLKIRVRDERSGSEAEQTITFEMVADPKLATSPG